jgi:L-asparaginase
MADHIHFIMTGGTIDSEYYPPLETSVPNKASILPEYVLIKIKPYAEVTFETLCMLDSSDITDEHRAMMVKAIQAAKAKKIILCHGTNTMAQSAAYIAKELGKTDKVVIVTGAMIPLKEFAMSDGGFNLGFAFAEILRLEAGVYVCMNARTFRAGSVQKNTQAGRFEAS